MRIGHLPCIHRAEGSIQELTPRIRSTNLKRVTDRIVPRGVRPAAFASWEREQRSRTGKVNAFASPRWLSRSCTPPEMGQPPPALTRLNHLISLDLPSAVAHPKGDWWGEVGAIEL